jgi:uridine kinase
MKFYRNLVILVFASKLLLSGLFNSPFNESVFIPFFELFERFGHDAWSVEGVTYPYPPLLTYILFSFFKIASFFESIYLQNIIYHIPILIADFGIYFFLLKFLPNFKKKISIYYLLSPILIFSSYIYSQHDLIPTALIFIASFYVSKKDFSKGFLIYGLSVALKWHTIIVLPVFLLFTLQKGKKHHKLVKYTLFTLLPLLITLLPFASIDKAINLFKVNESSLIFESFIQIKDLKIYLFPFLYSLIIVWCLRFKRLNSELFLGLNAIIFLMFIIVVYPNPGWFLWSLPFMTYSFIKYNKRKYELFSLYTLINITYLIFFIFLYKHPITKNSTILILGDTFSVYLSDEKLSSLVFTLLVSLLSVATYLVYISSIRNSLLFKRKFNAFLIGIAGDSATGKTTLLKAINGIIGSNATTLEGDAEHKWERGHEKWNELTHLNPKANFLYQQLSHLLNLKKGLATTRSDYNHNTGKFDTSKKIRPKDFVLIAGLHPFYLKGARENIDLKIFLDVDEELRKNWKVVRDCKKRGYSEEKVLEQIQQREVDAQKYISPQKDHADLVISCSPQHQINNYQEKVELDHVNVKYLINNEINVDKLTHILQELGCEILEHEYEEDLTRQTLLVNSTNLKLHQINSLFDEFFEHIEIDTPVWGDRQTAITQIVVTYCIREKIIGDNHVQY